MGRNKPNPKLRRDLINTFCYCGVISKLSPPRQIISNGESMVLRSMIVTYADDYGLRKSEIYMGLPTAFDHDKLKSMLNCKVKAKFRFCLKMKSNSKMYYNTAFCMSIEPIEKKYAHLRQEVYYDPYIINRQFRLEKARVDEEGYIYPYDY